MTVVDSWSRKEQKQRSSYVEYLGSSEAKKWLSSISFWSYDRKKNLLRQACRKYFMCREEAAAEKLISFVFPPESRFQLVVLTCSVLVLPAWGRADCWIQRLQLGRWRALKLHNVHIGMRQAVENEATLDGCEWAVTRRLIHRGCQVSHQQDLRAAPADCPLRLSTEKSKKITLRRPRDSKMLKDREDK